MPVTATAWRMVPSTPARNAYLAWKSLVPWVARAASWAWVDLAWVHGELAAPRPGGGALGADRAEPAGVPSGR